MDFRTINDLNNIIKTNLHKVSEKFDLIVAVPRSGFLPATLLSLYLNIPMTDIDNFLEGKIYSLGRTKVKDTWIKSIDEAKHILVVEDSSASGTSLNEVKKRILTNGGGHSAKYKDKCTFLVVFVTEQTKQYADIYFDICPTPRMFEWNFIHHSGVSHACFDIDGVLCEDPTKEQNDDGEKYIDFIRHAQPKYIPTFEVGYIVTSRLEKYRKETEEWLKANNVKYKKLIMLDLPNKEARNKQNAFGSFKGKIYKSLKDTDIFIESSLWEAKEIRNISGKFVFCTEISQPLPENWNLSLKRAFERKIRSLVPKPVKAILRPLKPVIKKCYTVDL